MKTVDKYLFQALDNYPFNLEETVESLDYALSYDDKNTMALCLYARVYAEQLFNYEEAKNLFERAIGININAIEVYPFYIQTLLVNEDWEEAKKVIDFALTIKGINKVEIHFKRVMLLELRKEFKKALKLIKEIKLMLIDSDYNYLMEETEKRLNDKLGKKSDDENSPKKKKSKKKSSK
jgi:tetratricopeptide (TPR) repeat protein